MRTVRSDQPSWIDSRPGFGPELDLIAVLARGRLGKLGAFGSVQRGPCFCWLGLEVRESGRLGWVEQGPARSS